MTPAFAAIISLCSLVCLLMLRRVPTSTTMKKYLLPILATLFAVAPLSRISAQEYFREVSPPSGNPPVFASEFDQFGPTAGLETLVPPTADEEEKYNFAIGGVRFSVAAGIGVEFNDNVTLADDDKIEDIIFRPSLTLDAVWRLSEMNTLRFSLGASYAKYLDHSEFDSQSVLLSPSSALALTIRVGEVDITVRDRFSYQEDPFSLPTLTTDSAVYRRFENSIGLEASWDINDKINLTTGYDHYNLWTLDSEFEQLERAIDTIYVRPSYAVGPAVTVGLNASASYVNFKQDIQNDGQTYLLGPFVEVQFSQATRAYLEVGYQKFTFDNNGVISDNEDADGVYVKASLENQLTENFNQRLSFTKTAEVGFGTNYYDLYHSEYSANWTLNESFTLFPSLFYEYFETSGDLGEEAHRFGAALGLRYIFTPSITLGLDYRFVTKRSDFPGADYNQNLVLLSLYYNF